MNLRGKNILITGASSGIGRELAVQLAQKGNNLALLARRKNLLDELIPVIKTNGKKIFTYKCDVSLKEEIANTTEKILNDMGSLDAAILNAGVGLKNKIGSIDSVVVEKLFGINVMGIVYFIEALIPQFKKQNRGMIVGVSSLADSRGFPGSGFYCASKAAVSKLLESLRIELKAYNIKVLTVKPGFVKTPMTGKNKFKMPFLMDVKDAAKIIITGIEKEKKIIQFPLPVVIGQKIYGIIPDSIFDFFAMKYLEKYKYKTS